MLAELRVHVSPVGETDVVRDTVPTNPLTGETVTVEAAVVPAIITMLAGFAATVKSEEVRVICLDPEKLVPITIPTIV